MPDEFIIDFSKVATKNENDRKFFEFLLKFKRVIYDWGNDIFWVLENYADEKNSKNYSMRGEKFLEKTINDEVSSGDMVVIMLCNGIDIDIRNSMSTFKTEAEKNRHMELYRKGAKEIMRRK